MKHGSTTSEHGAKTSKPRPDAAGPSCKKWEFIWDVAHRIDREALREAKANADALSGQRAVYAALGLDKDYEAEVARRREELRRERQP